MLETIGKYDVIYSCGCVHEIEILKTGMHQPNGNDRDCSVHKEGK